MVHYCSGQFHMYVPMTLLIHPKMTSAPLHVTRKHLIKREINILHCLNENEFFPYISRFTDKKSIKK